MTSCKPFVRRFLQDQMKAFQKNLELARDEAKRSAYAIKYVAGKVSYNRHAVAACKFMLAQLPHYYPYDKALNKHSK